MLKEVPSIEGGIGYPDWRLAACLAVCYLMLFLTMWKGVASSGKVAYVTGEDLLSEPDSIQFKLPI